MIGGKFECLEFRALTNNYSWPLGGHTLTQASGIDSWHISVNVISVNYCYRRSVPTTSGDLHHKGLEKANHKICLREFAVEHAMSIRACILIIGPSVVA